MVTKMEGLNMSKSPKINIKREELPSNLIETLESVYEINLYRLSKNIINVDDINTNKEKILVEDSYCMNIDGRLGFIEGSREECMFQFSLLLDNIEQVVVNRTGKEVDVHRFSFNIQSDGYDGFTEECKASYTYQESEHEYQTRQLKLLHIPDVLRARKEYNKVYNQKLQKQQLETQQQFEKELIELKKKHGLM